MIRYLGMFLRVILLANLGTASHAIGGHLLTYEEIENIPGPWSCDSRIFCRGRLLDAVQRNQLFKDSKTFVDMSLREEPDAVLSAFDALETSTRGSPTRDELLRFVNAHFLPPEQELEQWSPTDWQENPAFLEKIVDPALRQWANDLNRLWANLGRKIKEDVREHPGRYSILNVPNGFIIPGDRFREFYYWDTYWIVNGLLLSGMVNTARNMLDNLLHLVKQYGKVPNGGRIYYLHRSQPPLLTAMVDSYYEATNDTDFLRVNFKLLENEYNFWDQQRTVTVYKGDRKYRLSRYFVDIAHPRPEGYLEDLMAVQDMNASMAASIFRDIGTGAETGWDFSTRWFDLTLPGEPKLSTIRTSSIIPTDLNTYLCQMESLLAKFAGIIGQNDKVDVYLQRAKERVTAMNDLMWNTEDGIWYDFDLSTKSHSRRFYLSNVLPLLVVKDSARAQKVVTYLESQGVLNYPAGVPISTIYSGQQWDFPNAWPPITHLAIKGLASIDVDDARDLAYRISRKWLATNYVAWKKTGHMFEKYMVTELGAGGGGGEYEIQVGFGWSNGVVLQLLDQYGHTLYLPALLEAASEFFAMSKTHRDLAMSAAVVAATFVLLVILPRVRRVATTIDHK